MNDMDEGSRKRLADRYGPLLLPILMLISVFTNGQNVYNPSASGYFTPSNKPYAVATGFPGFGQMMKLDSINRLFRPFNGVNEVYSYFPTGSQYRNGNYIIIVDSGGTLQGNGTYVGGSNTFYMWKDSTSNAGLIKMSLFGSTAPCSGCLINSNNLNDVLNAGSARANLGLGSIATQSDTAGGSQITGVWPNSLVVAQFNGQPPSYYLAYGNLTGKPTIPAQFNPIQGPGMGITGTYPNITFSSTGGGTPCFNCNADSLAGLPVNLSPIRNGYVLALDSVTGSWYLAPPDTATGGGGTGLNQLTQDVLAGPGTGSQAATVVGIRGVGVPALSTGALTYNGVSFTWQAYQTQLNGTGYVKATGTSITYDNSVFKTVGLDSLWRTVGKDSIQFSINGRYHSILDSAGGGTTCSSCHLFQINDTTAGFTNGINIDSLVFSIGSGSGSTLSNNGSGFRLVEPLVSGNYPIQSLFAGTNVTLDSTSHAGSITINTTGVGSSQNLQQTLNIGNTADTPAIFHVPTTLDSVYWFGDSYTYGYVATDTTKDFASLVTKRLNLLQYNDGVPGSTLEKGTPINPFGATNMVDRISLIPHYSAHSKYLFFAFGLNDIGWNAGTYDTAHFSPNYIQIIDTALARGWPASRIFVINTFYLSGAGYAAYAGLSGNPAPILQRQLDYNTCILTITQRTGVNLIDIYDYQLVHGEANYISGDNIHPGNYGHSIIADGILAGMGGMQALVQDSAELQVSGIADFYNQVRINGNDSESIILRDTADAEYMSFQRNQDNGKIVFGNQTAVATNNPAQIDMGGSYAAAGNTPSQAKLLLLNGSGAGIYGFGVSAEGLEAFTGNLYQFVLHGDFRQDGDTMYMGNLTGPQTAPPFISMGTAYAASGNDPSHAMLRMVDAGAATYGLGVSASMGVEVFGGGVHLITLHGNTTIDQSLNIADSIQIGLLPLGNSSMPVLVWNQSSHTLDTVSRLSLVTSLNLQQALNNGSNVSGTNNIQNAGNFTFINTSPGGIFFWNGLNRDTTSSVGLFGMGSDSSMKMYPWASIGAKIVQYLPRDTTFFKRGLYKATNSVVWGSPFGVDSAVYVDFSNTYTLTFDSLNTGFYLKQLPDKATALSTDSVLIEDIAGKVWKLPVPSGGSGGGSFVTNRNLVSYWGQSNYSSRPAATTGNGLWYVKDSSYFSWSDSSAWHWADSVATNQIAVGTLNGRAIGSPGVTWNNGTETFCMGCDVAGNQTTLSLGGSTGNGTIQSTNGSGSLKLTSLAITLDITGTPFRITNGSTVRQQMDGSGNILMTIPSLAVGNNNIITGSSGVANFMQINPVMAQSSTAGYDMLLINPEDSLNGSGTKNLLDIGHHTTTGGSYTQFFYLTNAGIAALNGTLSIGTTHSSNGAALYFGANTTASPGASTGSGTLISSYSGLTNTDQNSAGTNLGMASINIIGETFNAVNAQTYTFLATVHISAPTAGTNISLGTGAGPWALYVSGNSDFLGNIITANNTYVSSAHFIGNTTTPGIAGGAGAGGSPTLSITGTDQSGLITITTGATPSGTNSTVATITYNVAYPTNTFVTLTPANAITAALSGTTMIYISSTSTTNFVITSGTVALTGVTAYSWYYNVGGQ